jgi:hypothetical protein
MFFLLGVEPNYDPAGEQLLRMILNRYGLGDVWTIAYCYEEAPPTRQKARKPLLEARREALMSEWGNDSQQIIGCGWMACEMLTGHGKTKLGGLVGTKWLVWNSEVRHAWVTYDPAAALFDPNLAVDISAVIIAAAKEEGLKPLVNKTIKMFNWEPFL